MSIYVGNLSYEVTQQDTVAVFKEYGIKQVQVPTARETGCPEGNRGGNVRFSRGRY